VPLIDERGPEFSSYILNINPAALSALSKPTLGAVEDGAGRMVLRARWQIQEMGGHKARWPGFTNFAAYGTTS